MRYISVGEAAVRWRVASRAVQRYCASGKIEDAKKYGRAWMLPEDAPINCSLRIMREKLGAKKSRDIIPFATCSKRQPHNPRK